jgi:hypothetical protein
MGLDNPRGYRFRKLAAKLLPAKATEQLQRRLREKKFEEYELTSLNDLLYFDVIDEYPDEIAIHVHETHNKSPLEIRRLAVDGLKNLAIRLESDPTLSHIKSITGYSEIVFSNPKLAEQFGFTVEKQADDDGFALARMSRADFVARYGSTHISKQED